MEERSEGWITGRYEVLGGVSGERRGQGYPKRHTDKGRRFAESTGALMVKLWTCSGRGSGGYAAKYPVTN